MFIIRKTYGWRQPDGSRKTKDYISLTQFEEATGIPKSHVSRTLKFLLLRKIIDRNGIFIGVNKSVDNWCDLPNQVNKNMPHQVNQFTQRGKCSKQRNVPHQVTTKEIKETITKESISKSYFNNNHNNIKVILEGLRKHAPKHDIIAALKTVDRNQWYSIRSVLMHTYKSDGEKAYNNAVAGLKKEEVMV